MLIKALIVVAVAIAVLAIVIALQPSRFQITRSATMVAASAVVFDQVNDLHKWEAWSPWQKLDPAMKQTYDGPITGPGASMHWVGNNKVGEGRVTIAESRLGELVRTKLDFIKPFAATNQSEFTFAAKDGLTLVTWTMTGERNFMMKAFGLIMNMDKMIGRQFDQGLAQMKSIVEAKQ